MNTTFLLMAQFNAPIVPLSEICTKFLNIEHKEACRLAIKQNLPFPVFRCHSQKSPWLVNISDLAVWLDNERDKAKKDWKAIQELGV